MSIAKGLFTICIVTALVALLLPAPALAGGGCELSTKICMTERIQICIPPEPCYWVTFEFPGEQSPQ